jgi:hypothetical protein
LSTCPILVKLRAKGFTERKDLCPQLNWQLLDGEGGWLKGQGSLQNIFKYHDISDKRSMDWTVR